MKLKQFSASLITLFSLALPTNNILAQVTIGAETTPATGAILQLKENDAEGINSTKGLGMPRVKLTNNKTLTLADQALAAEHTGILVYNTTSDTQLCPGLYVWSGTEWMPLADPKKPDIKFSDIDGNSYSARWFSSNPCDPTSKGYYWSTSNMRSTQTASGASFPTTRQSAINPSVGSGDPAPATPNTAIFLNNRGDINNITGTINYTENGTLIQATPTDFVNKFGLLYDWEAAQMVCPTGWHTPSNEEWDFLAKAIEDSYGTTSIGKALKANDWSYAANNISDVYNWGGFAPDSNQNTGFNILPIGNIRGGTSTIANNFGANSRYWNSEYYARMNILSTSDQLTKTKLSASAMLSVRCVQDYEKSNITFQDLDGNVYTAKWYDYRSEDGGGGNYWMISNLMTTKTKTGGSFTGGVRINPAIDTPAANTAVVINNISDLVSNANISYTTTGDSPTVTNTRSGYVVTAGLQYNYNQAKVACPTGWRLPTKAEWEKLGKSIGEGDITIAGKRMKNSNKGFSSTGSPTTLTWGGRQEADDLYSSFNAFPAGNIQSNTTSADNFSKAAFWWADGSGEYAKLSYSDDKLTLTSTTYVTNGFTVRCVKE